MGDEFDPSEYNVEEVNAYLAEADDTERERVLAAETDGKGRKGILEASANQDEEQADEPADDEEPEQEADAPVPAPSGRLQSALRAPSTADLNPAFS